MPTKVKQSWRNKATHGAFQTLRCTGLENMGMGHNYIHSQCFPLLKLFIKLCVFLKYNSEYKINKRRKYEDAYQLTRVNFVGFQHLNILNK